MATTSKSVKIFGREPAVIIGLIEAVLASALSFGWFDLSQETVGLIMAVVMAGFGIYTAYVTSETLLSGAIGLLKAVLALAAVYGLNINDAQTGAVIGLMTVAFSLFQRTQASPLDTPSFSTVAPNDTTTPTVQEAATIVQNVGVAAAAEVAADQVQEAASPPDGPAD